MNQLKIRVYDKLEKRFFQTTHAKNNVGPVREILFSQEGEIYLREGTADNITLTHEKNLEFKDRFIKDWYVGIRDNNQRKYFINDIVKFSNRQRSGPPTYSYGVLIWHADRLCIGSGPINDYHAIDSTSERELREAENVGNIYQDAKIIMGDLPGHI